MKIHKTEEIKKENAHFVELKYSVVVKIIEKDPDTGEPIGDPITQTTEGFIQAETIYGGDMGLRLYIKYRMAHLIRRLQDSSVYIEKKFNQH